MPNRLADATSPYLLQHADNPVDWYPWGEEAFTKARVEDKPVLLSVGYSSCHWCHVMAHESFEDPETALVMNELFVSIKVDREERPDVDSVYMEVVQAATGRGGWPMTIWLTPDGRPFYAGTYFPPEDRHGMPSFRRVMAAVAEAWAERREGISEQADRLTEAISQSLPPADHLPGPEALSEAYRALEREYDPVNGGFGGAPKFPQQPVLDFLLRIHAAPWAPQAGRMVARTLLNMARGGIHDHLGGGFSRYSVDSGWLVPHFEKMLYDNAQLARLYLWGWRELGVEEFRGVAIATIEYLVRDLVHPDGGFFAAEDADSEGVEGKFYVWSREEFLETAGPEDGPVAAAFYGVTAEGNFEGATILHQARTLDEVAEQAQMSNGETAAAIERASRRLLAARSVRVRPGLDDKVVASWNGLTIRALAEAGAALDEPRYLEAARRCARFVLEELVDGQGRLLRSWPIGRAGVPG
ncbi:MAG: thioredoxin domain-containing protein, partial [Acidimicrobiia bacterium]